jgi:hypothetical protein
MDVNLYLANVGASKNTYATLYREAMRCFAEAKGPRVRLTGTSNVEEHIVAQMNTLEEDNACPTPSLYFWLI